MQLRARIGVATALACVALVGGSAAWGDSTPPCKENEQAIESSPEGSQGLIELQPNAARPVFDLGLADKRGGSDKISFTPVGERRIGRDAKLAAEVTDSPRAGSRPFHGELFIAAHGTPSGRTAVLELCVERHSHWKAGRYQGTLAVYGPKIADFNYALVITAKWPWWSAVGIIGLVLLGFVVVSLLTDTYPSKESGKRSRYVLSAVAGLAVGIVLGALTYFTIYNANDTWGDDPGTQITALAIASFTAATGGRVAARKLFTP